MIRSFNGVMGLPPPFRRERGMDGARSACIYDPADYFTMGPSEPGLSPI